MKYIVSTKTLEALKEIQELLSVPERWIQGHEARNSKGITVLAEDKTAVCWCLVGAIRKVLPNDDDDLRTRHSVRNVLQRNIYPNEELERWNDAKYRLHGDITELMAYVVGKCITEEQNERELAERGL